MDDINKRLCELLDAEPKELTQSRDEWERLTLKAKAGFEGLLADYLDAARHTVIHHPADTAHRLSTGGCAPSSRG